VSEPGEEQSRRAVGKRFAEHGNEREEGYRRHFGTVERMQKNDEFEQNPGGDAERFYRVPRGWFRPVEAGLIGFPVAFFMKNAIRRGFFRTRQVDHEGAAGFAGDQIAPAELFDPVVKMQGKKPCLLHVQSHEFFVR